MRIRSFRARTVAAAMAAARAELGAEALILGTRRVAEGVELTAATEPPEEVAPPAPIVPVAARPAPDPLVAAALAAHGVPASLAATLAEGPDLAATLAARLRFEALPVAPGGTLLLAGPPGAGKTLTVAKIATALRLAGRTPRVIAADGRRAGAVEQLAAFTRLLGLDLIAAPHPATVLRALATPTGEATLIDTAGLDPFDAAGREEIAALAAASAAAVAIVLPAGMDAAEAAEAAAALAETGARHVVTTRLDIARRVGAVVAAAHAGGLAIAEAGTGPGVADGLAPLTAETLAARLLAAPAARPGRAAAA